MLGLRLCARAFSSCGKWGPLLIAVGATPHRGARTSHYRSLSLRSTGSRRAGSIIVAHGPSRSAACGIFPDQGSNPRPLHWQADSQPLRHQESPHSEFPIYFSPQSPQEGQSQSTDTAIQMSVEIIHWDACLWKCIHACLLSRSPPVYPSIVSHFYAEKPFKCFDGSTV